MRLCHWFYALKKTGYMILGIAIYVNTGTGRLRAAEDYFQDKWLIGENEYCSFASNAREKDTRRIMEKLFRFQNAFLFCFPQFNKIQDPPLHLVVCKDKSTFREIYEINSPLKGRFSGFCMTSPAGSLVVINRNHGRNDPYRIVYHEFIHFQMAKFNKGMPFWFIEGIAGCFESAELDDKKVIIGKVDPYRVDYTYDNFIPLDEFFHMTPSRYVESERDTSRFYQQSLTFVHFLLFSHYFESKRETVIKPLLQAVANSRIDEAFWQKNLGMDYRELTRAFKDYLRGGKYYYIKLKYSELPEMQEYTLHEGTPDDVSWSYARLQRFSHKFESCMFRLQTVDETTLPFAKWEDLGIACFKAKYEGEAREHLKKAIELGSSNAYVYYLLGHLYKRSEMGDRKFPRNFNRASEINEALKFLYGAHKRGYKKAGLYEDIAALWLSLEKPVEDKMLVFLHEGLMFNNDDAILAFQLAELKIRCGKLEDAQFLIDHFEPMANSTYAQNAVSTVKEKLEAARLDEIE